MNRRLTKVLTHANKEETEVLNNDQIDNQKDVLTLNQTPKKDHDAKNDENENRPTQTPSKKVLPTVQGISI